MTKKQFAPEQITLVLTAYKITGCSIIQCWDDSIGSIKMKEFNLNPHLINSTVELNEQIKNNLNDNGFGCKNVLSAYVQVWGVYNNSETNFIPGEYLIDEFYVSKFDNSEQYKEFAEISFYEGI